MNQRIFEHLAERFQMATGVDLRGDRKAAARLIEAAETAKIELTASATAHISLPYIAVSGNEPRHLEMDLTRTELERLVRPVIERCRAPVEQALHDAGVTPKDIDRIVFVGGPTRMPAVRAYFEELFGRQAELGIDPMECVASGAAIQAGVLSGEVGNIVLVDVTPLTLGVETLGGIATPLVARNTPIPVKHSETFTTAADMQTSVTIHVFQGERPMANDNVSLGEFNLDGLAPAPRGIPKVEVTFDIDSNGILNVSARDTATGKSQSIRISGSTRLSEDDKQRMVGDAEKYAEADKKRRNDAEALNAADAACYEGEKLLANFADKLTEELKKRIETAMRDTREALSKKDVALATQRAEELKKVLQEAGVVIYSQSPNAPRSGVYSQTPYSDPEPRPNVGTGGGEARPSGAGPRGKVVDADYKEG
jgi:molecular chaperone DnaK